MCVCVILYVYTKLLYKYTHTFPFLVTIRSSSIFLFMFLSSTIHVPFCSFPFLSFPFTSFHVPFPLFRRGKDMFSLSEKFQTNAIALRFLFFILFRVCFLIFPDKFAKKNAATPCFPYVLPFFFIFAETCWKKKTRLHHFSSIFKDFCLCPSIFVHFA